MAPEQITGDAALSGKADLYALGCCMFEMLTGQKPFQGDNFAQLFEQHLRAEPPHVRNLLPNCPKELDEIIIRLLAKDPLQRPFNARQVQGVMLEILDKYHVEPRRPSGQAESGSRGDVGAATVEVGRRQLQKRIAARLGEGESRDVSWSTLLGILAMVALLVIFLAIFMRTR
jgi:serine/threonine protein kinase